MEQQEPRRAFVKDLPLICQKLELTDDFMNELKEHPNAEYIDAVKQYKDEMARKNFILLEFTRERSSCDELIAILRKCKQGDAADLLHKYNTSPPFMPISNEIEIKVTPAQVLKSGKTKWFVMDGKPRGKCIIINNIQYLSKESKRFEHIFKELLFEVELCYNKTSEEIISRLTDLSNEDRLKKDNALIVMIISDGHDEKIVCSDKKDLNIQTIVDMFSEKKCEALVRKPKLFFFNCCRIKAEVVDLNARVQFRDNKFIIEMSTELKGWINENKYTLICFACAEGEESVFGEFTYFGQALSHCIAQYACDKSVQQIMNLTCDRIEQMMQQKSEEMKFPLQLSPEIRLCKMTRDLYLNPGLPTNRSLNQNS